MKIDRITYTHTYQIGLSQWQKIGMEASLNELDDITQSLYELKQRTEQFHRLSNPILYPKGNEPIVSTFIPEVQIEKPNEERRVAVMTQDMMTCKDLKTLETYKFLLKKFPQMEESYNQKLKELNHV